MIQTMLLSLFACGGSPSSDPGASLPPDPHATSAAAMRFVTAVPRPSADGVSVLADLRMGAQGTELKWTPLLVQGQSYGGGPAFGSLHDATGQPIDGASCDGPDFSGIFQAHGVTWMLSHLECSPAALVLSELAQDPTGALRVERAAPVSTAPVGALNLLCAGDVTPWDSVLSAEEYETDASLWVEGQGVEKPSHWPDVRRYRDESRYKDWARWAGAGAWPSPYLNGWMIETRVTDDAGGHQLTRHGSMGRFSHELGVVMPDQRTVYLSDDTSYGILAMFVADTAGDLSAGRLYAAKLSQRAGAGGDWVLEVQWVDLGHATDAQVEEALARPVRFDELFEHQPLTDGGACPAGLRPYRGPQSVDQCLAVKPGQELLASRLETRRFAALAGATAELQKSEGLALDPEQRRLYLATTRVSEGMLPTAPPWPEADHLHLKDNLCGVVWGFELDAGPAMDAAGQPIPSEWVARRARPAIQGYVKDGACADGGISEPDNLALIPLGSGRPGILLIAEDTARSPNRLWAWQDGALIPVLAAPPRPPDGRLAEVTGISWVPEALGSGWVTVSFQHPGGQPAMTGVLGPFPVKAGVHD